MKLKWQQMCKFFRIGERACASGLSSDKSGVLKGIESQFYALIASAVLSPLKTVPGSSPVASSFLKVATPLLIVAI